MGEKGSIRGFAEADLAAANVNVVTLLATDYLNHFNEAIMLLELVPAMPEMLSEVKAWQPKSYKQHFRDGGLPGKDLVCAAFDVAPYEFRRPFDLAIEAIERCILDTVAAIVAMERDADTRSREDLVGAACDRAKRWVALAGSVVNGSTSSEPLGPGIEPGVELPIEVDPDATMRQGDIDALFA